jgi:ribosomal protein S18 acetylase RimI-like enzyme
MAMPLGRLSAVQDHFEIGEGSMDDHVRAGELPPGLLAGTDHSAFRVLIARVDGEQVATALAFEHEGDCGIYNVGTREPFRRRGIGAAITALALHDAQQRGCTTASLQATPAAEGVYRALGFRDLGRYVEYVPGPR